MAKIADALDSLSAIISTLQKCPLRREHLLGCAGNKTTKPLVSAVWNVLHNFICGSDCEGIVVCSKEGLARRGYRSLGFYSLPNEASPEAGSLHLLLALSWLLLNGCLEEKIDHYLLQALGLVESETSTVSTVTSKTTMKESSQYITFHSRKLRHLYYNYVLRSMENRQLLHEGSKKLTRCTNFTSSFILSSFDHGQLLQAFVRLSVLCSQLLRLYISWKANEKTYIKWIRQLIAQRKGQDSRLISPDMRSNAEEFLKYLKNLNPSPSPEKAASNLTIHRTENMEASIQRYLDKAIELLDGFDLAVLEQ